MDCIYADESEEYTVRPMLGMTCATMKCCEEVPACFPCLPRCPQKPVQYCCEKPKSKARPRIPAYCDLREHDSHHRRERSPRPRAHADHEGCCTPPPRCEPYCPSPCKPVKTKYVIPCYRYEDGRIANQHTLLMRRACEVAIGARPRRKPFVESCFLSDSDHLEHRYISEDDRGNCCYHFEKKTHYSGDFNHHHPFHHSCAGRVQTHDLHGPCHSSPECHSYGHYVSALPAPFGSYGS